jgi:hypothetical protein
MGEKTIQYPENINGDRQFDVPAFTKFFTEHGTKLWFSEPEQPHKNASIERFWRALALLLQRMRVATKNFDWVKSLPKAMENYNSNIHNSLHASPIEVLTEEKDNQVERKVVESVLKKGDKVRIKHKKSIFEKGDVQQFSKDIYLILEHKGTKNKLKNLNNGEILKRLYTDEELDQTFMILDKKEIVRKLPVEKPKLKEEELIARRREKGEIKRPERLDL